MYTHQEEREVESKCYDLEHVDMVLSEIKRSFDEYYDRYILSEAGKIMTAEEIEKIATKFGVQGVKVKSENNQKTKLLNIVKESIDCFEKDRNKYLAILDKDSLDEYEDDPSHFKSIVLKNECPIIHSTIHNKNAKVLDKYRYEFSISDPNKLLTVVRNLHDFANHYFQNMYDPKHYDKLSTYKELNYGKIDTDDYTVYGVIGGGIKSHLLFKYNPEIFPNRSRDAIWALWFLTKKKVFGCHKDSEFLMIDVNKSITQQNYFYPYELFSYYAHQVYILLNKKAEATGVYLDPKYRYVFVDSFLSFVSQEHHEETNLLSQQIKEGVPDYA
jgi:hypothetical protein